jgi:hypothetical protein
VLGEKWPVNLACDSDFNVNRRVLLHAENLRHGTSPSQEGMLWIFPAGKIRRLRSGANPRSWVPEASMLTTRPPKLTFYMFIRYIDCQNYATPCKRSADDVMPRLTTCLENNYCTELRVTTKEDKRRAITCLCEV